MRMIFWVGLSAFFWLVAGGVIAVVMAAPPADAPTSGPIHEFFQRPDVQWCCARSDCRPHEIRSTDHGPEVKTDEGKWIPIPPEADQHIASPNDQTWVCIIPGISVPRCVFWGGGV